MLNPEAKLNPNLFDEDVGKKPIRDGYGEALVLLGEENPEVVVLSADLAESTRAEAFAKKFPDRFFEVGVAEQNMATIAAGLGVSGKIPFISSFAIFSPGRNWEQIRTTIAYNDSNVKIAGHHAGLVAGPDGATHQATEDIAIMRTLPNMKIFAPCDAIEAKKATLAAAKIWGPVYLRFSRPETPIITTEETPYVPGKTEIFWQPRVGKRKPEAVIIACGFLVHHALLAALELDKEGIGVIVLNSHTVKPLDEGKIIELAKKCGAVVTVEDHQIIGGLAGAVAETLAKHAPRPIEFVGLRDIFGESGPAKELVEKYGLGVKAVKQAVKKAINRKK
jgi:transketolase